MPISPSVDRRRGVGRRRRGASRQHITQENQGTLDTPRRVAGGRQFGGRLTQLHADAPEFIPGQPTDGAPNQPPSSQASKSQTKPKSKALTQTKPPQKDSNSIPIRQKRRVSLSRSTAPDIASRTHEDINKGIYECAICTNDLGRNSKIWTCHTCWTVFHLSCVRKWAKNEGSAVAQQAGQEGDILPPKQWRCPGCNLPKDSLPSMYTCWCEKEIDPHSIAGLPPHSCGQSCGRERTFPKACPHPCELICHAGPCPPCSQMGPVQSCFCAKEIQSKKCIETNYDSGWSCEQPCGDLMPCGEHSCQRPCHEGLCGACKVQLDALCYCGRTEKQMPCHEREEPKESNGWTGIFSCHRPCERRFDCEAHSCEKPCHPQGSQPAHCPRSPNVVNHCPCGKTPLTAIPGFERQSCTDPIPSCEEPCGKSLACGHACQQICHSGPCLPCLRTVSIHCRCGRNSFKTICHQGADESPLCMRICKSNLNCGRHECGERCCTGERKASDRQATKRKLKPLGAIVRTIDEDVEPEHICTRTCGRPLKCGSHICQDLCHKGPCTSCREAIFEDLSCACGRTILQAPLPCGTKPPLCNQPCLRSTLCGHARVPHNCHADDELCPPCPYLTEKKCLCAKKVLKNIPCWRTEVSCGLVCEKRLKCGSHICQKPCHQPGECEDRGSPCQQPCGKPKKICGHPCEKPCHAPSSCKEDKPCPFKIMITCLCQRRKEETRCNARLSAQNPTQNTLKCDEECARLERNRQLRLALEIPDDHVDDHVPYSNATLQAYGDLDIKWSHLQEEALRVFAADENEKRYRFAPMKAHQRSFVHHLCEDFGFDSESLDPEPHRHVLVFKTPKFVAAPMKTLSQAARIRRIGNKLPIAPAEPSKPPEPEDALRSRYNGILLKRPRFALTEEDLKTYLAQEAPRILFDIYFLIQQDSVALVPSRSLHRESTDELENLLRSIMPRFSSRLLREQVVASCHMCAFDQSQPSVPPSIQFVEPATKINTSGTANGWSQIAGRKAASAKAAPTTPAVGQRPIYTVLGSKLAEAKKKKQEEEDLKRLREEQMKAIAENWDDQVEDDGEGAQ